MDDFGEQIADKRYEDVVFASQGRSVIRFQRRTIFERIHIDAMAKAYYEGRGFSVIKTKRSCLRGNWFDAKEW